MTSANNKYIIFKVKELYCAVNCLDVQEIIRETDKVTTIPGSENYIDGVLNLRGSIVTIINLALYFKLDCVPEENESIIILNDDDEHILNYDVSDELIANTNELSESVIPAASRCTTELLTNISCFAPEPLLAPEPTIPHPCITPEPLLILPSCPILNPCTPLEPPSINVEAPPQSEQESASDMDMGSSQSLTKKKKSKFKKFFKIRKKKKKNKLDAEQYKSTPSLSPGPSEHSQATIRSVYSMNSVLSNLDPDERNIASD